MYMYIHKFMYVYIIVRVKTTIVVTLVRAIFQLVKLIVSDACDNHHYRLQFGPTLLADQFYFCHGETQGFLYIHMN